MGCVCITITAPCRRTSSPGPRRKIKVFAVGVLSAWRRGWAPPNWLAATRNTWVCKQLCPESRIQNLDGQTSLGLHRFEKQNRSRILPEEFCKVESIEHNHMFHVKFRLWRSRNWQGIRRDANHCKSCFEGSFRRKGGGHLVP